MKLGLMVLVLNWGEALRTWGDWREAQNWREVRNWQAVRNWGEARKAMQWLAVLLEVLLGTALVLMMRLRMALVPMVTVRLHFLSPPLLVPSHLRWCNAEWCGAWNPSCGGAC